MDSMAKARYLRISTMKVRKIIKLVRGRSVSDALAILKVLPNKAAKMAYKVIFSAKANFKQKFPEVNEADLIVQKIFADEAPILRRVMPRARGRADVIRRQNSHLTAYIGVVEKAEKAEK